LGDRSWGAGYYLDLLPAVVAEIDPSRPYWPGSPYSGSMEIAPNDQNHGCMHIWDVWNQVDYSVYRDYVPRFAAEYGWQAPPTWSTLTEAIHDRPIAPLSPSMYAHQKAPNGDAKLTAGLAPHFPPARDTAQWLWAMQLNQARAVSTGITHQRSHRGVCMGSVVWQINDCWPVISWAAIDGAGRPKPLWHALRRSYEPVLLTVQPRPDGLVAALVSERDELCSGVIVAQRCAFDGQVLATARVEASLAGRGVVEVEVPDDVATPADPSTELLVVRLMTAGEDEPLARAEWFFGNDRTLAYPPAEADVEATRAVDGVVTVQVRARTLVRDLYLQADRVSPDARVSDGLVTLLPGDQATFEVSGVDQHADLSAFGRWPVLCTANDLVAAPR
jgi:beta-mannosidase